MSLGKSPLGSNPLGSKSTSTPLDADRTIAVDSTTTLNVDRTVRAEWSLTAAAAATRLVSLPKQFHPSFNQPGKQPVGRSEIDWNNPITRGLKAAWVMNTANSDVLVDLVSGLRAVHSKTSETEHGADIHGQRHRNNVNGTEDNQHGWQLGQPPQLNNFTTEASIVAGAAVTVGATSDGRIFSKSSGGLSDNLSLAINSSNALVTRINADQLITSNDFIVDGEYNNLAMTFRSGESAGKRLFANGVYVTAGTQTASITNNQNMAIGRQPDELYRGFSGSLYYVYVWDRKLSDAEVLSLHHDAYQILKPAVEQSYFYSEALALTGTLLPLPKRFHPDFSQPGKKPLGPAVVDPASRIPTQDMDLWLLGGNKSSLRPVHNGRTFTESGTPVYGPESINLNNATTYLKDAAYSGITGYPFTLFLDAIPSGSGEEIGFTISDIDVENMSLGISGNGSAGIRGYVYSGPGLYRPTTAVTVDTAERIRCCFVAPSSDRDTWGFYINGKWVASGDTSGTSTFPTGLDTAALGALLRPGIGYKGGEYFAAAILPVALTDEQARLLTTAPYAELLRPAVEQSYFIPSVSTSTLTVDRTALIEWHVEVTSFDHPNLLAAYTMDNISGSTLVDETGNHDGTITGAIAVSGVLGNALSFDGVDDSLSIPAHGVHATKTTAFWYKSTQTGGTHLIYEESTDYNSNVGALNVHIDSNNLNIGVKKTAGYQSNRVASSAIADGEWKLVVITYDKNVASDDQLLLYINAVLQSPTHPQSNSEAVDSPNVATYLGSRAGSSFFADLDVDQLRIYNRVLTQAEITTLYQELPLISDRTALIDYTTTLTIDRTASIEFSSRLVLDRTIAFDNATTLNADRTIPVDYTPFKRNITYKTNAASQYWTIPDLVIAAAQDFEIEVQVAGTNTAVQVLLSGSSGDPRFYIGVETGGKLLVGNGSDRWVDTETTISDGKVHTVVWKLTSGTLTVSLDGVERYSAALLFTLPATLKTLGADEWAGFLYTGYMLDAKFWTNGNRTTGTLVRQYNIDEGWVNSDVLVDQAATPGAELWHNPPSSVGTGWTDNGDDSYTCDGTGNALLTDNVNTIADNDVVVVTYTVEPGMTGTVRVLVYGSSLVGVGASRTAPGTYTELLTVDTVTGSGEPTGNLIFQNVSGFTGTISGLTSQLAPSYGAAVNITNGDAKSYEKHSNDTDWVKRVDLWPHGQVSLADGATSSDVTVPIQIYRVTKHIDSQVTAIGGSWKGLGETEWTDTLQYPEFRNTTGGNTDTIVFTPTIQAVLEVAPPRVAFDRVIPLDSNATLAADRTGLIEYTASLTADRTTVIEWNASLNSDRTVRAEWVSITGLDIDRVGLIEWAGSINSDRALTFDYSAVLTPIDRTAAIDYTSTLTPVDRTLSADWTASLNVDRSALAEWAATGAIDIDRVGLIEWLSSVNSDRVLSVDYAATAAPLDIDRTVSIDYTEALNADRSALIEYTGTSAGNTYYTDFQEYGPGNPLKEDWIERWNTDNTEYELTASGVQSTSTVDDLRLFSWNAVDDDPTRGDVDIAVLLRSDTVPSSGTSSQFYISARGSGVDGEYTESAYSLNLTSGGLTGIRIMRHNPFLSQLKADYTKDWDADTWYWTRFRISGQDLKAKVWPADTQEPAGWDLEYTDNSATWKITGPGWIGIGGYESTGTRDFRIVSIATNGDIAPLGLVSDRTVSIDYTSPAGWISADRAFPVDYNSPRTTLNIDRSMAVGYGALLIVDRTVSAEWTGPLVVDRTALIDWADNILSDLDIDRTIPLNYHAPTPTQPSASPYVTDFREYPLGEMPFDWTMQWDIWDSEWTIDKGGIAGGMVLQNLTDGWSDKYLLTWDAINADPNRDDIEVLTRCTSVGESLYEGPHAYARCSGDYDYPYGYFASIRPSDGQIKIASYQGWPLGYEDLESGTTTDTIPFVEGDWWWIRLRVNGTSIKAKFWKDGTDEPATWQLDGTDTKITGVGWAGVGNWEGGSWNRDAGERHFDYVSIATSNATAPLLLEIDRSFPLDSTGAPRDITVDRTLSIDHHLTKRVDADAIIPFEWLLPEIRATKVDIEVLHDLDPAFDNLDAQVTKVDVESLYGLSNHDAQITTVTPEAIYSVDGIEARTTALTIEVLRSTANLQIGTGTTDDPYLITSAHQMFNVRNDLAAHYAMTADIDLFTDYPDWVPIGTTASPFTGTFDGRGKKVTGLESTFSTDASGLFGVISGAAIIRRVGVTTTATGITGPSTEYQGVLVGDGSGIASWTIEDCYAEGKITHGGDRAGGLIGNVDDASSGTGGSLKRCWASVDLVGTVGTRVGAFAGYSDASQIVDADNYFDSDVESAPAVGSAGTNTDIATAKTTVQMKQQATFTGWDFAQTWSIVETVDYPRLDFRVNADGLSIIYIIT